MPKKPISTTLNKGSRTKKVIRPLGDPQRSSSPMISTAVEDMGPPMSMKDRAARAQKRRNGAY